MSTVMQSMWTDARQMSEEAGVSKMTIYRLIHAGVIPASRVGRSLRVKRSHWERYLQYAQDSAVA